MADFIEEMQTEAKLRFGKELSPAEVAKKFAEHGFEARIYHLKAYLHEIEGELDTHMWTIREASGRIRLCAPEHMLKRETHLRNLRASQIDEHIRTLVPD